MTRVCILGVAQDAGIPHVGCSCPNCERYRDAPLFTASLGIVAPSGKTYLIDATGDFSHQIRMLPEPPSGVFLTQANYGHYAGLMQLGREGIGAKEVPVYGSPKVIEFLRNNAPWELLERLGHVRYEALFEMPEGNWCFDDDCLGLNIEWYTVPHRTEYADTLCYQVSYDGKGVLYVPDIDYWDHDDLLTHLLITNLALIDGSVFSCGELGKRGKDVSHSPMRETLDLLADDSDLREKIRFLHFNHTNPVLDPESPARAEIEATGAGLAVQGEWIDLA